MNVQNIISLAERLQTLGIENTSSSLLKRICFDPERFIISKRVEKENEQLTFHLFLEKDRAQNSYALIYYDAILQKEMDLTHTTINGINTTELEKRMAEIDRKIAFELDTKKQWSMKIN